MVATTTNLSLQNVVAGSLPAIDVKYLSRHKPGTIEVKDGVHDVGYISHPAHGMEGRHCLVRFNGVHRLLYYSRRYGVHANSGLRILNRERLGRRAQCPLRE